MKIHPDHTRQMLVEHLRHDHFITRGPMYPTNQTTYTVLYDLHERDHVEHHPNHTHTERQHMKNSTKGFLALAFILIAGIIAWIFANKD